MNTRSLQPHYSFRATMPSLWQMAVHGMSDAASVIPNAILDEPAVQLPGPGAPLIVACPDLARQVLNDRADHFQRDTLIRRAFRRTWGGGLAGAEGADWQAQRKAAAPFFRPQAIARHFRAFANACDAMPVPTNEAVDLATFIPAIIARIITTSLVNLPDAQTPPALANDVAAYVDKIAGFSAIDLLPLPESLIDFLHGIDRSPPVRRIRAMASQLSGEWNLARPSDDMIAKLAGVGPIEENIRGLFPAAMDTTASGICWTLYVLAMHPEWQRRVADEARASGNDLSPNGLPITRRVVNEALRLYPPAPMLLRAAAKDTMLGDFRVRRGQPVGVSVYALHRHRQHWDDPDAFDPDRFSPERGHHAAYMPFGLGPRMCIAAQFALAEITTVVARILSTVELSPAGPSPKLDLQITTRSRNGLIVLASDRR